MNHISLTWTKVDLDDGGLPYKEGGGLCLKFTFPYLGMMMLHNCASYWGVAVSVYTTEDLL